MSLEERFAVSLSITTIPARQPVFALVRNFQLRRLLPPFFAAFKIFLARSRIDTVEIYMYSYMSPYIMPQYASCSWCSTEYELF